MQPWEARIQMQYQAIVMPCSQFALHLCPVDANVIDHIVLPLMTITASDYMQVALAETADLLPCSPITKHIAKHKQL